ncbi:ABC transporter G family member 6-like [Andrographis paniculata]|uniref:ABC transporter G family member 6-like n=1 Tax=Andrographis paniculata TaxID=175694 RepID=UPI0021E98960|nr:ABC transporter G family member 6-like [Andrographis paniculata]
MSRVMAETASLSPPAPPGGGGSCGRNEVTVEMSGVMDSPSSAASYTTLGHLLKCVSDVRKEVTGDETPAHAALDMSSSVADRPLTFVLSFSDLTYSVRIRRKVSLPGFSRRRGVEDNRGAGETGSSKTLLNNISGEARDGEIMAVMGASGSGKSTLIDALANRIAKESLKGSITLNGERLESRLQKIISAYVMQDDLLFPMLTVEETLTFAADIRLPRNLSRSKKKARVQALIDQLGLRNAARTVIGDEGRRGVSGGERRRVSIGIDIIHDPILLFLDEPTSGLDSTSAFMLIKVLQRIAQNGSIVIASVHQPSNRILGLLDRIIFLSRGNTVYSGSPSGLSSFFSAFGKPIPAGENRAEFAMDLIRELESSPGGTKSLEEFHRSWEGLKKGSPDQSTTTKSPNMSLKEAISAGISRGKLVSGVTAASAGGGANPASSVPNFANPPWVELTVLSKRSLLNFIRTPELFGIRLAVVMVTGFLLATVFWKLDDSPKGVQERLGFFAFAMSTTFYSCADTLPVFLQERYIFMRETAHNAYRRSSYVLSHSLVSFPPLILLAAAFAAVTFWSVGLDGGFLFYFLIILASFWAGNSFVTFLSGVIPQVMLGYIIAVAMLAYFLLFSGFFINRDRIPDYWIWFHYISLVKYPYEAVLQNEFAGGECFVRGVQIFDGTPLAAVPAPLKEKLLEKMSETLGTKITLSTCVTTGVDILRQNSVTDLSKWGCFWVTVAWGFFFRILFYLALLIGSKNKRR